MIKERYSRQRGLTPNFDQTALQDATALIAGVGGLGTNVATNLTMAGVGRLILCDHDTIAMSNLNRQTLYREDEIGCNKVDIASERLQKINPDTDIVALCELYNDEMISRYQPDIIVDCLDNLASRIELIAAASRHGIPLIHGAVEGLMGQISTFIPGKTACPICPVSESDKAGDTPPPSLGSSVAIVAGLQATEVVKYLTRSGELCTNRFVVFDGLNCTMENFEFEQVNNCIACSEEG
ncbi:MULTISPECIES: HesA/MoeB/ThiF family protein [Desulfosediminicola]|uniref:HesA/MoeB/ThiF family protein n=1 Tax=Desulfosediminicola TaxID=2886823 RepID=UPI0010ABF293|nr:HesA/MoeB/ThiF family protein [Desulfosediminicola ganghwensis]